MSTNRINLEAIFVGCNRELQVIDYNPSLELVAYGSKNSVAIWNPSNEENYYRGVVKTLNGHKGHIVSVKWLPASNYLLSCSEDNTINIWKFIEFNKATHIPEFELTQTLDQHKHTVTTISVFESNLFVTGSADGELKIWGNKSIAKEDSKFELLSEFNIKKGFYPLSISLHRLEKNNYVIFIGGTNTNLYVYSFTYNVKSNSIEGEIEQSAILTGHEDWIRSIVIKKEPSGGEFLIASGSQDRYIRLWKLRINEFIDRSDQDKTKLRLLSNKQYKFQINENENENKKDITDCSINFDAIIMGHDDWISELLWHPTELKLLSSSADTSIMMWEPDESSGIWVSKIRLGEMSIKGASTATGASGGFWSCCWIIDQAKGKEMILTGGKTGSIRSWIKTTSSVESTSEESNDDWKQITGLTGTIRDVTDLEWSDEGDYLLSTSLDQTTRLISRWCNESDGKDRLNKTWHEFARPQIHGYDMICVKPISNSRFLSGGDEKVLRSFNEPKIVGQLLEKFCGIKQDSISLMPESASLPVLGLSNKAADGEADNANGNDNNNNNEEEDDEENGEQTNVGIKLLSKLNTPPLEDHLQRFTLWPEIEKLYGHGYEITTVDVSPDKKLIASASRSNNVSHGSIRLFRTDDWLQLKNTLSGHELTITRVRFSPNNKYLLSVSRDRQLSVWNRNFDEDESFGLIKLQEKAHNRIIWDCCWFPIEISEKNFITGSRDKFIKVWKIKDEEDDIELVNSIKLSTSITSLDSYKSSINNNECLISVGLENGDIEIYTIDEKFEFKLKFTIDNSYLPNEKISRLSFASKNSVDDSKLVLAIGSTDSSVRILSINKSDLA